VSFPRRSEDGRTRTDPSANRPNLAHPFGGQVWPRSAWSPFRVQCSEFFYPRRRLRLAEALDLRTPSPLINHPRTQNGCANRKQVKWPPMRRFIGKRAHPTNSTPPDELGDFRFFLHPDHVNQTRTQFGCADRTASVPASPEGVPQIVRPVPSTEILYYWSRSTENPGG
jgi:hypothetical protein